MKLFTNTMNYVLLIKILIFLLVSGCDIGDGIDFEPNSRKVDGVSDLPLSGDIIFLKTSDTSLNMANVKSISSATQYGNALSETRPVWSNDGSKFASIDLIYSNDTSNYSVKIVDAQTGNIKNKILGDSRYITIKNQLGWSRDNRTVIMLGKNSRQNTIVYMNTETGDTVQTHFNLGLNTYCSALAWHPKEDIIAVNIQHWESYNSDNTIWFIKPYETTFINKFQIKTCNGSAIEHLDWNSEGTKLLYSTGSYHGDLFVVNYDGNENKVIPNIHGCAPCWSNDGKFIMYTSSAGMESPGFRIIPGLFVSDIDGSLERLLLKRAKYSDWY